MKRRLYLLLVTVLLVLTACQLSGSPAARPAPTQEAAAAVLPKQAQSNSVQPVQAQPEPTQPPALALAPTNPIYMPLISGGLGDPMEDPGSATPPAPAETVLVQSTHTPAPTQPKPGDIARLPAHEPHTGSKLTPDQWKQWPVLPVISQRTKDIYILGLARGNDPKRFSKIGDCQVIRQYFLGYFDDGDQTGRLGDSLSKYSEVLDNFKGSYTRVSMSVRTGFNVASVLAPMNSDPAQCKGGETPLECEFRHWNPAIVIISMETWTADRPTQAYESYLRQIVDFVISRNVVPILATKADNLEGDHSINAMVARVAYEYDIPLWNFWAATDPLPSHGLESDGFHLTNGPSVLTNPENMKMAWNVRNLTALQSLDLVWRTVKK